MDSDCTFYQGPWTEGGVLFVVGWQKDVHTQETLVEAYTIIPTTPPTLDSPDSARVSAGLDPASWIAHCKLLAAEAVRSKLRKMIPVQQHVLYPELTSYEFNKISESMKPSAHLMRVYSSASQGVRDLLLSVEKKTQCEALRDCLKILRELFPNRQTRR
jgi:hypothetical protein